MIAAVIVSLTCFVGTGVAAGAPAGSLLRIVRPASEELVNGRRMVVVVSAPAGTRRFRVLVDGRNVTRRFRPRDATRVGTLTGVPAGAAHVVVSALVGSQPRWAFSRVYVRGRRDRRMIVLLNANATLVRHAADAGVARLAIRVPEDAILRATLNGRAVDVPVDFRTGDRLAVFNRADGLRRGRNTLHLVAYTRDGRYDTVTRSASIPRSAPMAVAGPNRRIVAGQTVRLNGRGSVPGRPGQRLAYRWRVVRRPAGSSPRLRGAATAAPKLRLREPGRYTLAMTVTEHGLDGTLERSTDLVQETVAPSAPPAGAPIDTMAQQGDQTGIRIGTSPTRFYPAPPDGQIGVIGLDPGTLSSDPDLNTVISDSGDVDAAVKDAVAKFTKGTIVVVTARDCCSASSKLLPKIGAFSYITSYDGSKDDFGQSGTWNRNLALTDNQGTSHTKGALTGLLRYQPSEGGFRFVQDGAVSYSTSASTQSTLGPSDGATYRILSDDGNAVDVAGDAATSGPLGPKSPSSALSQQWQLQRAYGDYYRIVNGWSGYCMNLNGVDSTTVQQYPCTGNDAPNELWFVNAVTTTDHQHYYTLQAASQPPGAKSPVVATMSANGMTVAPLDPSDHAQRFTFGLAPGLYTITDQSTGKLVGEPDFDADWGTRLAVGAASGQATQQWRVVDGPGASFKLVNVASGLCMDVTAASSDSGTPIERYACDPNDTNQPNELWSAVPQTDGIALVAKGSGLVLSRQQDGLVQRADNDDKGQRFSFDRVSAPVTAGGDYSIEAVSATGWGERRAVDVAGATPALDPMSTAATQQWKLRDAGQGLVQLYSLGTGKCLTPAAGASVSLATCDAGAGIWRVDRRTDGTYALTNTGQGGGVLTAGAGTALTVAADQGAASQDWMLGGRPVTMQVGGQRLGTTLPFGAAGFVVTAFDASRQPITGTLTADDGGTIPAPSWPAAYVTNGTPVSEGESLGILLQGLAKRPGTTVLVQSIGRPKPGFGWNDIATGIADLGGDATVFRQLDGSGDYSLVGCAGCTQATQFDETARRASDPDLIGARLQGALARNESSTYAADTGSGVAIDSSIGDLIARPSSPWPFADTSAGRAALNYIAEKVQPSLTATCNDSAELDPVRNSYCLQNVNASTPWAARALDLSTNPDLANPPAGVDATTWDQVKAELHTEWVDLDNIHRTLQSLSSVYSSVATGSNAQAIGTQIAGLIQDDLHQAPPASDVTGDVLNIIAQSLTVIGDVVKLPAAEPEPDPESGSLASDTLGLLSDVWSLASENDGATDAAGDTIHTSASNYATDLDLELAKLPTDLPAVENALVSDPVRLEIAGSNANQDWTLPQDTYSDLQNGLKAGLARSLWTKLLPGAYDLYQFPRLPADAVLSTMRCNGHLTFPGQPAAAVFSQPTSFDGIGNATSVTLTLSPKTVPDDLEDSRHVGQPLLNALFGVPAANSPNGGFSPREITQLGLDVRDQTAKQPNGATPIFSCYVFNQNNTHSWQYDTKSKSWTMAR